MSFVRPHVLLAATLVLALHAARRRDRRALTVARAQISQLGIDNQNLRDENERLQRDPVTGVLLRLAWTDIARQKLPGLRNPAVLLIDINNLKPVNDASGHAAGDELLREIIQRLQTLLGPHALAGRLGGDEFAVLIDLPAGDWRGYLRAAAAACVVNIAGVRCGAAMGAARPADVAARDSDAHTDPADAEAAVRQRLDRLLHAADLAMYRAKRRCHDQSLAAAVEIYGPRDVTVPAQFTPSVTRVRDYGLPAGPLPRLATDEP